MARYLGAFVIMGLILSRLDVTIAKNNTTAIPMSNSSGLTTTPKLPITMAPATGLGHFNVSCILLDISCSVTVDLHVNSKVQTVTYDLPLKATASGTCVDQKSEINLVWSKGPANLTISMILDVQKEKWTVSSLGFTARTDNQPLVANAAEKEVSAWQNDTSILKMTATSGKSFKCDQDQDIPLKAKNKMKVTVMIKQIHLQPFDSDAKKEFGEADVCSPNAGGNPAEPVDTIVPTAVGCVLAGLIVILIITYIVGRCRRPGYQKM